jgi:cytoskeletal protein CcmA (bactofilin family)
MPSRSKASILFVASAAVSIGLALPAGAAEIVSSDLVIITEDTVVTGDHYVAANRVLVRGTIDGDLFALAGQDVSIEGEVTGSVTALASEVSVSGIIGGSLRVTSPSVQISGEVSGDVVAVAFGIELVPGGQVGADLVMWAWNAGSHGSVSEDVEGSQRRLELSGDVTGNVRVSADRLSIVDDLRVGGDLTYRSNNGAVGIDLVDADGVVVQQTPMKPNIRVRALALAAKILVSIVLAAMALVVSSVWPERSERAMAGLEAAPFRSFLTGAAVVLSPVLVLGVAVSVLAFAPSSTALPLIAALIPLLFAVMGIVLVASLFAGMPAVAWIGARLKKQTTVAGAVAIGSAVVAILWLIPVVGWITALLVLAAGMGGWLSTFRRQEVSPAS